MVSMSGAVNHLITFLIAILDEDRRQLPEPQIWISHEVPRLGYGLMSLHIQNGDRAMSENQS